MPIKLYVDRLSQPCRACVLFCKMNQIPFEEVSVSILAGENRKEDYLKIHPFGSVPAMVDTDNNVTLLESSSIVRYLATIFNKLDMYPVAAATRAQIDSALDWHHSQLRIGVTRWVFLTVVIKGLPALPEYGSLLPPSAEPICDPTLFVDNAQIVEYGKSVVHRSFNQMLDYWLTKKFIVDQFSIADLFIACELEQLTMLGKDTFSTLMNQYPGILGWLESVRSKVDAEYAGLWSQVHYFR